jgi:glycine cleavage system H protein
MPRPTDRQYLPSHEWAKTDGDIVTIGITDFAVESLTDLTYVDLPDVGDEVTAGKSFGEIESVKAVSDLNSAVSGEVVEVNEALKDEAGLESLAKDPFGAGWMIKVKPSGPAEGAIDAAAYEAICAEGH